MKRQSIRLAKYILYRIESWVKFDPTISVIWTECSRIVSQGTNWGAFSSVLDTQGKELNKFFKFKT
jgi:hypothetical protein